MTATLLPLNGAGRGTRDRRISRIVVATDGSPHAMRASDAARDLARRLNASVDVVAAWDLSTVTYALPGIASSVV